MLLYPQVSSTILSAFNCRLLDIDVSRLEADYSVNCNDDHYVVYRRLAFVLVVMVPVGFPLGLLSALLYQWRESKLRWIEANGSSLVDLRPSLLQETAVGGDMNVESLAAYHQTRVQKMFGFCTTDFRPDCFWYEPVDMLRKLSFSGLLQFVHRGTAAQCCLGCVLAFVSFGAQQGLRPYREPETNVLKALVDTQLFLTFLVSFILRVLPEIYSTEPFDKDVYGWLLLVSMAGLLVSAFALTVVQVRRRLRFKADLLNVAEHDLGPLIRGTSWTTEHGGFTVGASESNRQNDGVINDESVHSSGHVAGNEELANHLSRPVTPDRDSSALLPRPQIEIELQLEPEPESQPDEDSALD